jgi:hypothetical protein
MLDTVHCLKCIWELQLSGCRYVCCLNIKAMVAIETGTLKLGYYTNRGLKVQRLTFQLAS